MSLNVACGRCRFLSRYHPGPWLSVSTRRSEPRIAAMDPLLPPEQANTAPLNEPTRSTSCVRAERIGPTFGASLLWNTVAKRVGPAPHASNTMSANSRPDCGRASGSFDTFTTTAGRAAIAGSVIGSPVKGITGSDATVVDVLDDAPAEVVVDPPDVLVADGLVVGGDVSATVVAGDAPLPPQATRVSVAAINNDDLTNFTIPLGEQSALRAADGCRTCG